MTNVAEGRDHARRVSGFVVDYCDHRGVSGKEPDTYAAANHAQRAFVGGAESACYFYARFSLRSEFATVCLLLLVGLAQGCARANAADARTGHDEPVPANEPRAELRLTLDLPRTSTCEEDFDLALYRDRAVDLIEWGSAEPGCSGRRVKIRYLSRRIERTALVSRVQGLASKVRVEP
jgi:hypothetical protein